MFQLHWGSAKNSRRNISRFGSLSGILIWYIEIYTGYKLYPVYISIRVFQRTGSRLKILDQSMCTKVREICNTGYISTEQNPNSYNSPKLYKINHMRLSSKTSGSTSWRYITTIFKIGSTFTQWRRICWYGTISQSFKFWLKIVILAIIESKFFYQKSIFYSQKSILKMLSNNIKLCN